MKLVRLGLGVFGIAVAAGVLMFGVLGFGSASAAPGPGGGPGGRGAGHFGDMQAALAAKLGISVDTLKAAETAARDQLIQDAVGAGKLTQAQADALKNGQKPQGQPGQQQATPGQNGQRGPNGRGGIRNLMKLRDIFKDYQTVLAQKLGVTPQQLQTAEKAARDQLIDDAVKAGKLTQAQADAIKSGQRPNFGNRGAGGPGNGIAIQGVRDAFAAAASTLNMKPEDLQAQLRSGKSLAEIAQSKGVDRAALRSGIMGAIQTDVNNALRDGKITSTQATSIIDRASKGLDQLLDRKMGQRGQGNNNRQGPNRPGNNNARPNGQQGPTSGQPQFLQPRGA